ncbi:hypothetical protein [Desulfurobacterium sp.]
MKKASVVFILTLFMGGLAMAQKPPVLPDSSVAPPGQFLQQPPPAMPPRPPAAPPPAMPPLEIASLAEKAVTAVKEAKPYFSSGKIWQAVSPRGEKEVKGAVIYEGRIVAVVKFDPVTGTVLPEGFRLAAPNVSISENLLRKELERVIREMKPLDGAEYREPERCWVVPLSLNGKIVGHVKVSEDGRFIVPDYPAEQEAGTR